MIRVLTADDEPWIRSALRSMLHTDTSLRVVADCAGREARSAAERHRPDVVLLDIQMLGGRGLQVLRDLTSLEQPPATLVVTNRSGEEDVLSAFAAGALGYLLKNSAPAEVIAAVHRAAAGEGSVSGPIAPRVIDGFREFARIHTESSETDSRLRMLTEREREVLCLLGRGLSNREIARRLTLSPETVKTHMGTILSKLGTTSRVQAALVAERNGLLHAGLR